MPNKSMRQIGSYAFILGVLLAIVLGFMQAPAWTLGLLAILGLAVATLNVRHEQVNNYLLANLAVIIGASTFSNMLVLLATPLNLGTLAGYLQAVLGNLVFFVAPGAVLIALTEVYAMAQGTETASNVNHFVKSLRTG